MRRFWNARGRQSRLEKALHAGRPRPREELVAALADALTPVRTSRRAWSRAAFAAALTTFMLGTFASFGGVSYAAQGAANAVDAVKRVATPNHVKIQTRSSASDQYGSPTQAVAAVAVTKRAKPSKPPATQAVTSGQLPFTGVSLTATAALGFLLIGAGLVLRRRERRDT